MPQQCDLHVIIRNRLGFFRLRLSFGVKGSLMQKFTVNFNAFNDIDGALQLIIFFSFLFCSNCYFFFVRRCFWLSFLCSTSEKIVSKSLLFTLLLLAALTLFSLESTFSMTTSGTIPMPLIHTPEGVKYLAVVKRKPEPSGGDHRLHRTLTE